MGKNGGCFTFIDGKKRGGVQHCRHQPLSIGSSSYLTQSAGGQERACTIKWHDGIPKVWPKKKMADPFFKDGW